MREQDEGPYIVIERGGGSQAGPFLVGALIGAGLALLFAPKSGEETQAELKDRARRLRDSAEDRVKVAHKQLEERLDTARAGMTERLDSVKEAVSAGRQAAVDARGDLEQKLERSKAAYRAGIEAAREAVTAGEEAGGEEA